MRILPYGTLQFIFMERIANALGASMAWGEALCEDGAAALTAAYRPEAACPL
jgi:hypothetical protein